MTLGFTLGFRHLSAVPVIAIVVALISLPAAAETPCTGHQAFETPRPPASCLTIMPEIFMAPDGAIDASVLPVDVSLYVTPDMESRVVIRAKNGDTLNSEDYASPRGMNGYYVLAAKWSPDSQFFVYSLTSSGGHQPWSFPIVVYSRKANAFAKLGDMIGGKPTISGTFEFSGPHMLIAQTWKTDGAIDQPVPVKVDLAKAFAKLKPGRQ
jgi:hypothetical protein